MSFLRSKFLTIIVALLTLSGYGYDLLSDCGDRGVATQVQGADSHSDEHASKNSPGCDCVCHQVVPPFQFEAVNFSESLIVESDYHAAASEIPPDAVPLGIEYPPQNA